MTMTMMQNGADTAKMELDTTMIRQLPQGAAWTTTSGNATITAKRTNYGMTITATAPRTPKVTVKANAQAQNQQTRQTQSKAMAKADDKPPEKRHSLQQTMMWAAIVLNSAGIAILVLASIKNRKQ